MYSPERGLFYGQKRVPIPPFFSAKKGNSEKSYYVYCRLSIRFLGVPLFGEAPFFSLYFVHTGKDAGCVSRIFVCREAFF